MATPAFEKRNELTDIINQVKDINSSRGAPAGRGTRPIMIEPGPAVRSAAMARPPVLPSAEKERLDQKARELGLMPPEESPQEIREILQEALVGGESPARERVQGFAGLRSLPDFTKVQVLDLVNGVAVVDGMEFPIPLEDIPDMKGYVVQLVTDAITARVADALIAFGLPQRSLGGMDGTTETVQQVWGGERARQLSKGSTPTGRVTSSVPNLSQPVQPHTSTPTAEPAVDGGVQGDDLQADESPRVLPPGSPNPIDFVVSPEGEVRDLRNAGMALVIDEDMADRGSETQPPS